MTFYHLRETEKSSLNTHANRVSATTPIHVEAFRARRQIPRRRRVTLRVKLSDWTRKDIYLLSQRLLHPVTWTLFTLQKMSTKIHKTNVCIVSRIHRTSLSVGLYTCQRGFQYRRAEEKKRILYSDMMWGEIPYMIVARSMRGISRLTMYKSFNIIR